MKKFATLSPCGTYRYWLERRWEECKDYLNFVMLNPSTADHERDDHTIRKCIGFAKRWGYGGIHVTNLFALRSTCPANLRACADPVGPENDTYLKAGAASAPMTIVAWGGHGSLGDRAAKVLPMLGKVHALAVNGDGSPKHPLYVPYEVTPVEYTGVRS